MDMELKWLTAPGRQDEPRTEASPTAAPPGSVDVSSDEAVGLRFTVHGALDGATGGVLSALLTGAAAVSVPVVAIDLSEIATLTADGATALAEWMSSERAHGPSFQYRDTSGEVVRQLRESATSP
jgi:anti-anti-sigma regulatory factor